MQRTERFFERGGVPVAALFVVVLLGAAAIAFDSAKIATSNRAQLAQTETAVTRVPHANPAIAQDVCVNDRYITITVQQEEGSKPVIKSESGTYTREQTPLKKGCYARFCAERTATRVNPATEACTEYRFFGDSAALVNSAARSTERATEEFAQGVVSDARLSGVGMETEVLSGLRSNVSDAVLAEFDAEQANLTDAYEAQSKEIVQIESFLKECDCVSPRAQADLERARADAALTKSELDSLTKTQGTVKSALERDPGVGVPRPSTDPNADPRSRAPSTFDRDTRTPPYVPPASASPGAGVLSGILGLLGGGQQSAQQQQCITSYNPLIMQPYPARPGCLNYNAAQQQCGALLQLLDKCPTGSYNPSNPNNPYGYPAPTCTIRATPERVNTAGQATTLQWQSQNASYAYLSNSGQIGPSGTMQVYPQTPTTYTMTVVGYGNQQGQCSTQVGIGAQTGQPGGTPKAEISCQPQSADVGTKVAIAFACQNAASAGGSGFSTGGALSGSAVATVGAPALGQNTITYGLTCSNQGQTHGAQCTVNVNKTAIVLVANPKSVASGKTSNIGWVSAGMDSCTLWSPTLEQVWTGEGENAANTSGVATTPELATSTKFVLECETKNGNLKVASTTVLVAD